MAEELIIDSNLDRAAAYDLLIPQIASLIADEHDWIANLANVCAAIHSTFQFLWVGFYRVVDQHWSLVRSRDRSLALESLQIKESAVPLGPPISQYV